MANGDFFRAQTERITNDELAVFMDYRYKLLTEGGGNLCTRAKTGLIPPLAPFDGSATYEAIIGSMYEPPWTQIRALPTQHVISPNPFALSAFRASVLTDDFRTTQYAFAVWDAAIGIPSTSVRDGGVKEIKDVAALRNSNTFWAQSVLPNMRRVGPLGPDRSILRPAGPCIFDLTRMADGAEILEAAHVLAHYRGDDKSIERKYACAMGRTEGKLRQAVTEIIFSRAFDLPLDISRKDHDRPGEPDACFGIEIKSSTTISSPMIRLPWSGREAARIDETLAVVLTAVFIEPHPYGFTTRSGAATLADRWCCLPTIVIIGGWECVDFITHQALGELPDNPHSPTDYIVRVEDLLTPQHLWLYMALSQRYCRPDGRSVYPTPYEYTQLWPERWMYYSDWLKSERYRELRRRTPPFPCKDCYSINRDTEGAPKMPTSPHPRLTLPRSKWPEDWIRWYADRDEIMKIQKKAIELADVCLYGNSRAAKAERRARRYVVNEELAAAKEVQLTEKAVTRKLTGHALGRIKDEERYQRWEQQRGVSI